MDRRTLLSGAAGATLLAGANRSTGAAATAATSAGAATTGAAAASPWSSRGTVRRAGGVIGYAIAGQGPTLVAMPKLGGWIDDWVPLARELARDHRLIAIDPPGHGSSKMNGEPPTVQTLAESAAMVRATLEELEVTDFVLMGNSLGGCIAATMAGLWPKLASHLVLISVAVYPKDPLARIIADQANADPPIYAPNGDPLPRTRETAMGRFNMSAEFTDEMNRSRMAAGRWIRASERGVRSEASPTCAAHRGADAARLLGQRHLPAPSHHRREAAAQPSHRDDPRRRRLHPPGEAGRHGARDPRVPAA